MSVSGILGAVRIGLVALIVLTSAVSAHPNPMEPLEDGKVILSKNPGPG